MTILNLTPHPVKIERTDGTFLELPKGSTVPRLSVSTEVVQQIEGINVVKTTFGETVDLPAATESTILIVSRLVKDANPERTDLVCPGEAIRDEAGKVVGSRGFSV